MHPINRALDKNKPKRNCSKECKNFKFPHRDTACVLSDVYSVKIGEPCAIFAETKEDNK